MEADGGLTGLRVLCLEDNDFDAELVRERLLDADFDLEMRIAANRSEFLELLTVWEFDIVLADYKLPDFDALGALRAALAAGVDVPFICVSGEITQDQATELLNAGAADYILKDQMGKIPFAVRRALLYVQEEVELRESRERFQQLFENLGDGAIVHDEEVLLANPAAHRTFGFPPDFDMTGMAFKDLIHPDWWNQTQHVFETIRSTGESVGPFEHRLVCADGAPWYAELTTSPVGANGRMVFETVFRDLTERRRRDGELLAYRTQLEKLVEERGIRLEAVTSALNAVTAVISRTVEIRDPYTAGHQRRVAALTTKIAEKLGISGQELEDLSIAAAIHDIGKVSIPAEILSKPSLLSPLEFNLVTAHAQAGYDIISSANLVGVIPEIVLQHHERCDGSGYPKGLKGDQLLFESKILMVADVVEAMSSHRPYRKALGILAARDEIVAGAGVKYDGDAVAACLHVLDRGFTFEAVPA